MDSQLPSESVSTCACRHKDARQCYMLRYPPPVDDLQRLERVHGAFAAVQGIYFHLHHN